MSTNTRAPRAIIIGSGFGGLSLGIRLQSLGFDTTILEKLDGPGGRAYTKVVDGFTFDMGPTVITVPHFIEELFALERGQPRLSEPDFPAETLRPEARITAGVSGGPATSRYVKIVPILPFYRIYFDDGSYFDYDGDPARTREQIQRLAPQDLEGYERATNYSQAIVYCQRALDINANLPHVLLAMGRTYAALGQASKAIFYFDQAILIDPLYAEAWERKGATHIALLESEKAVEALNKSIEADPTRYTAFARRGEANFYVRLYERAIADYTRAMTTAQAISQTITPNDYIFLGFSHFNVSADQCPQAIEAWRKALSMAPESEYVVEYVDSGLRKCKVKK